VVTSAVLAGITWTLLGWMPVLLVLGGVTWVLYSVLFGGKGTDEG
jgi:hypothetical protein